MAGVAQNVDHTGQRADLELLIGGRILYHVVLLNDRPGFIQQVVIQSGRGRLRIAPVQHLAIKQNAAGKKHGDKNKHQ